MDRIIIYVCALWLVCGCNIQAQQQIQLTDRIYTTANDRKVVEDCLSAMAPKKALPMGELVAAVALHFLGVPYVASTLEKEPEGLVVNVHGMDCATFVDNVIALARTVKGDSPSFDNFCRNLQQVRYRNGVVDGYASRLHYTSDWLYENDKRGIVEDINAGIGGVPLRFSLSFMSTHPASYRQLEGNPALVEAMAEKEKEINARTTYHFIPKDRISESAARMQSGDMVCFTTAIKGLDTSHVGFIYWQADRLTFIHASSSQKRVTIEGGTLEEYAKKGRNTTGIMLARPLWSE